MRHAILLILGLGACSDRFLEQAEADFSASRASSLIDLSDAAGDLSRRYVKAASATRTVQDVTAFLVFASAFMTVSGAVGNASDEALAHRALAGAGAQQAGARLAPKTAIEAIYKGARRLNCVATAAAMGAALEFSPREEEAALAATLGSIEHIRILTREGLVRDVPDFDDILTDFSTAAKSGVETLPRLRMKDSLRDKAAPGIALDQYLNLLAKCTATEGTTIADEIPAKRN